jgi:tetratricopeptide (TPR) repeat protein
MDDEFKEYAESFAHLWFDIGCELNNKKEFERAIKAYNEGLNISPNSPPILFNLSCVHHELGNNAIALDLLNRYLAESEDKFAFYKKSIILKALDRTSEAISSFNIAENLTQSPLNKYCIDERKKAAELLNLKIETLEKNNTEDPTRNSLDLLSDSIEQITKDLTSFITKTYPDYGKLSIPFLVQNYLISKGIDYSNTPIELKNKVNRIQFEVERELRWDLVPSRIKTVSSDEIASELAEFIKNDLSIKGRVWVRNYSKLFWETQKIDKWACPTEIRIKLIKAEGLAQDFFDNEQMVQKKTNGRKRKPASQPMNETSPN